MASIVGNRVYNDPALGAAFGNLAQMFAPPSGSDASGYAAAAATKEKAARLAELFSYAKNPSFDQTQFDRMNVADGNYSPNQSYYAVDLGDATTRRGQDVSAATSRANTADTVRGSLVSDLYGPLNQGQVRPSVPTDIASLFGLPAVDAAAGAPKPLSETEVKGGIIAGLPKADQTDMVLSDIPVETAIMGGQPQFVRRSDAVGLAPAPTGGVTRKDAIAELPDGSQVAVTRGPNDLTWSMPDGSPVPPEARISNIPTPQGSNAELGIGTTASKSRAQNILAKAASSEDLVNKLETLIKDNPAATGAAADVLGFAQNARQVLSEFTQAFQSIAPNAPIQPEQVQAFANDVLGNIGQNYNPVYAQANAMLLELAYSNAALNNGGAEVSRAALEREIEALGSGLMGNDQSVLASLSVARDRINRARIEANALLGGDGAAPVAPAAAPGQAGGAVEEWVRGPDGKLVRK